MVRLWHQFELHEGSRSEGWRRAVASAEGLNEEAMASTEGIKEDIWDDSDIF